MQVQLGPLVVAAAGSIGGTTFQRNPIGTLVRSKPLPTLRRSRYTNAYRGRWQEWSRLWRTLSTSDQLLWQTEADLLVWTNRFGDVVRGLGYWLFMRCNQNLTSIGMSYIGVPASPFALDAITGLSAAGSVAITVSLSWSSPSPLQGHTAWLVFASPPMSNGRVAPFARMRLITTFGSGVTSPRDVTAVYNARFGGNQRIGQKTFFQVQAIDADGGYAGPPAVCEMVWT